MANSKAVKKMRKILMMSDYARTSLDYEFMDTFGMGMQFLLSYIERNTEGLLKLDRFSSLPSLLQLIERNIYAWVELSS